MVGAILLVSALIFGALAGGVVVQRLLSTPVASGQQRQVDRAGPGSHAKIKQKDANESHQDTQQSGDAEDKDA